VLMYPRLSFSIIAFALFMVTTPRESMTAEPTTTVSATAGAAARPELPGSMRAAAFDKIGEPDVLAIHTLPVPVPAADEVLIAVHTAGVAIWDADIRRKLSYVQNPHFPFILGSDGSGTVAAVGSAVTRFQVGDLVYSYNWNNPKGGFYAEYVAVPAIRVARLPKGMALDHAGALGVSGLGLKDGCHYLQAETVSDFVAQVRRLEADPELAARLATAGRKFVVDHYAWPAVTDRLVGAFAAAANTRAIGTAE